MVQSPTNDIKALEKNINLYFKKLNFPSFYGINRDMALVKQHIVFCSTTMEKAESELLGTEVIRR